MAGLFSQLGVDWKLLVSQTANFSILLVVLTIFVYKPLLRLMADRRAKIEEGLEDAKKAKERLAEIDTLRDARMAEADHEAAALITEAEREAGMRGGEIVKSAESRADEIVKEGALIVEQRATEEFAKLERRAERFIREAITKTVEMDPAKIDEKLIKDALRMAKENFA